MDFIPQVALWRGAAVLTDVYLTLSTIQWSLPVLWKPSFKEIPFHTLRIVPY